jgi:uncharacterized membrane protein YczE
MMLYLLADFSTPETVAWISRALTAGVGLFVAGIAYRGFRRNDAAKMLLLGIGIAFLTAGVFLAVIAVNAVGAGDGLVLLARGLVSFVGLCAILYAFFMDE